MLGQRPGLFGRLLRRFFGDGRGNVTVMMTLLLVPIIGATGMGAEASNWYLTQRAIQNAADAAVIAAALNDCDGSAACATSSGQVSYDHEGKAVAAKHGFADGGDTTVAVTNAATCPSGGSTCYGVTITRKVPFYMLRMVGFNGDTTTTAGLRAQTVVAVAKATHFPGSSACVTSLGTATNSILVNGGPDVHFNNCDAYTPNGGSRCNGISGGGAFRSSYMASAPNANPCPNPGPVTTGFTDNYASLHSSIPASPCGGNFPQALSNGPNKNQPSVPENFISNATQLMTAKCGDIQLQGPITVTNDTTLYIYNGRLDLNGFTLSTTGSAGLTIVFTGTPISSGSISPTHSYVNTSNTTATLDISSPTSNGTWKGVAVYQDDAQLTGSKNNLNFVAAGNNLTTRISGLFYAPASIVTLSGNITFSSSGYNCLSFIVYTMTANGSINMSTVQCNSQGLTDLPKVNNLVNLVA